MAARGEGADRDEDESVSDVELCPDRRGHPTAVAAPTPGGRRLHAPLRVACIRATVADVPIRVNRRQRSTLDSPVGEGARIGSWMTDCSRSACSPGRACSRSSRCGRTTRPGSSSRPGSTPRRAIAPTRSTSSPMRRSCNGCVPSTFPSSRCARCCTRGIPASHAPSSSGTRRRCRRGSSRPSASSPSSRRGTRRAPTPPVHVRTEERRDTICVRGTVTAANFANVARRRVHDALRPARRRGRRPAGPSAALYGAEIAEDDVEPVEAFVPISEPFPLPRRERVPVTLGEVPGATVAVLVHAGDYDTIADTYRTLGAWVARHADHAGERVRELVRRRVRRRRRPRRLPHRDLVADPARVIAAGIEI